MGGEVLVTRYGAPARELLATLVDKAKCADQLAPVTVVTATVAAGTAVRRRLASSGTGGLVNVRSMLLTRLAEQIGAAEMASLGRRPLTSVSLAAATRAALDEDPGVLASVAAHPSTVPSLLRSFRDLRELSPAQLEQLQRRSQGVMRATVALFRRVRSSCAAGWYDRDDLHATAAEIVRSGRAELAAIGEVVVHLQGQLRRAELDLLDALAAQTNVTVVIGRSGDAAADRPGLALLERLAERPAFSLSAGAAGNDAMARRDLAAGPEAGVRSRPDIVVSAPDADEEVRSAIRLLLDHQRAGTRLDSCALLYPVTSPYALLVAEQLDAASLPWSGVSPHPLSSTIAGRVLLGAVELACQGSFPRGGVIAWLACGPLVGADGHRLSVAAFDRLSCDAGIVGGERGWQRGLSWHRQGLGRLHADGRIDEQKLARRLAPLTSLEQVVNDLFEVCACARAAKTWSELGEWSLGLLDRYLGPITRRAGWTDEEVAGERRVRSLLGELAGLDELDPGPRLPRFSRALGDALSHPAPRVGAFGTGITVGAMRDLAGIEREVVVILGAIEGNLLTGDGADPLMPSAVMSAMVTDATGAPRGAEADRHAFATALATATVAVCTYPRGDQRNGRRTTRSRLLAPGPVPRTPGAPPAPPQPRPRHEVPGGAGLPVEEHLGSFAAALNRAGERASATDYELTSLLAWSEAGHDPARHFLAGYEETFGRGMQVMGLRAGESFSRFDGHVGAPEGRPTVPGVPEGESFSPTRLQAFATCPFSYLLANVLGVEKLEGPEERFTISAMDRGSLMHEVLERFGRESKLAVSDLTGQARDGVPGDAGPGWGAGRLATAADEERLRTIFTSVCIDFERRGLTGKTLLWEEEKSRMWRALRRFVVADAERMQTQRTVPIDFELGFGSGESPPVEIAAGARVLRFRGTIDRVDEAADGSLVVADYKTGRGARYEEWHPEEDPVDRGTLLQLPLYALAAGQAHGAPGAVRQAEYRLVERAGDRATVELAVDERTIGRMTEVITTIVGQIEAGCFPARPGPMEWKGPKNCRYCDYDRLCSPARAASWAAKRSSPLLAPYVELAEGDSGE
jgi:ATP-dependent helicase/nuclease subunit B